MSLEHSPARSGLCILRRKTVSKRCDAHVTSVMRWATNPKYAHLNFPRPVQMADGSVGFYEHEVDAWLAARPRVGEVVPA